MATYGEAFTALDDYRLALFSEQLSEDTFSASRGFAERGASSPFATPLNNVHATGIGVRTRKGRVLSKDFCIKVFVFQKLDLGSRTPQITGKEFHGVGIDVEHLPIQVAQAKKVAKKRTRTSQPSRKKVRASGTAATSGAAVHRARTRPVIGGVQISPMNARFVGTIGGLVQRGRKLFALSNNHVLADTNRLPRGATQIVQPAGSNRSDIFATLSDFERIRFPMMGSDPRNRIDAAIAEVTNSSLVATGQMLQISNYRAQLATPMPNTDVTKSGQTTGVTTGTIIATRVNGVRVDYGTPGRPLIATFDNCMEIRGKSGAFSMPGDSGSLILDKRTGRAVGLLFAGAGNITTGCDLGETLQRFRVGLA